jgi:hypothetical protein
MLSVGGLSKELGVVVIADTRYWDEILQLYATIKKIKK